MMPFDTPWWIIAAYVFTLGCVVGSFLNVVVHRLPMGATYREQIRGLWTPPSRCPKCMTRIRSRDNLPIIGWILLKGRCRSCRTKISWRYPAVELFNGLMITALYFVNVPIERWSELSAALTTTPLGPYSADTFLSDMWLVHARFFYHCIVCELLLVAALIDFDLTVIPEILTDWWIAVGIACSAVGGLWLWPFDYTLGPTYGSADPHMMSQAMASAETWLIAPWMREHPALHGLSVSAAGAFTGFFVVWSIRAIGTKIIGVEAVGAGDVWLMGMAGSFLGWQPTIIAMILSLFYAIGTVIACLASGRMGHIPYGPYLSLGSITTILGWHWIWPRTAQLFDLGPIVLGCFGVVMLAMLAIMLWLVQVAKRVLGIELYSFEQPASDWGAADQNQYLMGELPTQDVGQWKQTARWEGIDAGRGQVAERRWRGR